jgi:putative flippase GtrA
MGLRQRSQAVLRRFLLFAGAGALGTCVHYATLITLVEAAGLKAQIAAAAGATVGAVINYVLNYKLTFRSTDSHAVTAPRFAVVAAGGLFLSWLIVLLSQRLGVHYVLGQIVATALTFLFGFFVNYLWVFSTSTADELSN